MKWLRWIIAAVFLALPAIVAAQATNVTPMALQKICSETGSLSYSFGQQGVPLAREFRILVTPPRRLLDPIAGFQQFMPKSTAWSDQLWGVDFVRDSVGKEATWQLAMELDAILPALGWSRVEREYIPPEEEIDFAIYEWKKPITIDGNETSILLGLSDLIGKTILSCDRTDLMGLQMREALGELPPDTPRPVAPSFPIVLPPTLASCDEPEIEAQINAFMSGIDPGPYAASLLALVDYYERLADWKMVRLRQSDDVDQSRLLDLMLDALYDSEADVSPMAAYGLLMEVLDLTDELRRAQENGNRQAACTGFVKFNDFYSNLEQSTFNQWRALHAVLDSVAAEHNVSLD